MSDISSALTRVRRQIWESAERSGRSPEDVTVVAISKTVAPEAIREAAAAGQTDFGENRAQEFLEKYPLLETEAIRWHFVGRLQRNKVKHLVGKVALIHSVDRIELAEEIDRRAEVPAEVLIEVNTTGEAGKGGVDEAEAESLLEKILGLPSVRVTGLMTLAPVVTSPEEARGYFKRLGALRARLDGRFPEAGIRHLSMGMSQDYAVAVEEGATLVRIGEAIFGPRPRPGG